MTKCTNERCEEEATVQFDHCGTLTCYCDSDWKAYKNIMDAMGSPIPVCYPVGVEPLE